jgi:hypothetical protein
MTYPHWHEDRKDEERDDELTGDALEYSYGDAMDEAYDTRREREARDGVPEVQGEIVEVVWATEAPEGYLTAGKRYRTEPHITPRGFFFVNDEGRRCFGLHSYCAHLHNGSWNRELIPASELTSEDG